ncbi:MAG TPA: ABC transporter permease, partial [Thermoanaerobaculia bacterium]|nr:ABC transporter permease [Thermoanaerobaculia bacterium]
MLRTFTSAPFFAAAVVLTIAVGVGPTTAIFSIVHSVLLRELPYRDPGSLVAVWRHRSAGDQAPASGPDFADIRSMNQSFTGMAVATSTGNFNIGNVAQPLRVEGTSVSANWFAVLGGQPLFGSVPSGAPVGGSKLVVLSQGLSESLFGAADPSGRELRLNGEIHHIAAVMPREFAYPQTAELWVPFDLTDLGHRALHQYLVVARLKPGVTVEQATADVARIAGRIGEMHPETSRGISASVQTIRDAVSGDVRRPLLILLGAVALLLLIACSNAANLMLTRAAARQRDLAVRSALGATDGRLARLLLAESIALALAGGVAGLALAHGAIAVVRAYGTTYLQRPDLIAIDGTVLVFNFAICLATGVLFGLAPLGALRNASESLKSGARTGTNRGWERRAVRDGIVVGVVALSYLLLVGAGLLLQSYVKLRDIQLGFRPDRVLSFRVFLPPAIYGENEARTRFYQQLVQRLRTTPGVESAATVSALPLERTMSGDVSLPGVPDPEKTRRIGLFTEAGPGVFRTLGAPLIEGRDFTDDDSKTLDSLIVNQTFARRFFGARPAVGQKILIGGDFPGTIVGVVGDVRQRDIAADIQPQIYLPLGTPLPPRSMTFVVRASTSPRALMSAVRMQLAEMDPDVPPYRMKTMDELVQDAVAAPRFHALLMAMFAAVALALATIGIYSVVSYGVAQRTKEMGVRLALGASGRDLLRLVIARVVRLAATGIAVGMAAALVLTRAVETLLFNVSS